MKIELNKIYNEDNATGFQRIESESVDVILEDPPYLYLKNQKLDRPFDEQKHFQECKRILKRDGFIVLFGRGESFYRWNMILSGLGFIFKEEIIWNKRRVSSPCSPLARVHETIAIYGKGGAVLKKSIINYGESKAYSLDKITQELKRLGSVFDKGPQFEKVIENIRKKNDGIKPEQLTEHHYRTTMNSPRLERHINSHVIETMLNGVREQSIIEENREHLGQIHPTQKPIRLIERLLALVSSEGCLVVDGFSGSASTAIAAHNTDRNFIGFEIDKEYYDLSIGRLNKVLSTPKQKGLFQN